MSDLMMINGKHETQWVTISMDEYDSMKRTIDVLSDRELVKQLIQSKEDKETG